MTNAPETLRSRLRGLREAYASLLPSKVSRMEEMWSALQGDRWDPGVLGTIHRIAHSLAGSGATLGHPAISQQARALEAAMRPALDRTSPATSEERNTISARLEGLRDMAAQIAGIAPEEDSVVLRPPPPPHPEKPLLYIVGGDGRFVEPAEHYGYETRVIQDHLHLQGAVAKRCPDVIILDTNGTAPEDLSRSIAGVQEGRHVPVPVVFVSTQDDFVARLRAVHAGGNAYVTHPVDIGWLVDKLDELTGRTPREPYRILIVEDEPLLSAHNAAILEQAGMVTSVVRDPLQIFEPLAEFRPDLVLMDAYMSGCTGTDLAAVIRQHEDFVGIPIVFLSTETGLDRRLQAMMAGGDDFLIKPLRRELLVSSIASRVSRARTLRSIMEHDGLTRLLNHTHLKTELEVELNRAQRRGGKLGYAILDIDHFKGVNDTHGHRAGDRVLRGLARLLRERFRAGDLVGRYGGEEFVVALIDADLPQAGKAIEELRSAFARVTHSGRAGPFAVTFSAGVADFPRFPSGAELHEAADRALYQAKHQGRNRVVVAPDPGVRG